VTLLVAVQSTTGRIGMIALAIRVIFFIVSRPTKRLTAETE
jgi:hypothetical protein